MNSVRPYLQTLMPAVAIPGLVLLYVLASPDGSTFAQESPDEVTGRSSAAAPEARTDDGPATEHEHDQRQKSAMVGLLILSLVCLVFLVLIVLVLLWARRMRRMVGRPLPGQHRGDPLWYLRKSDASVSENDDQV